MAINPNWPVMLYEWGPHWNCNGAAQPLDRYVEVTARSRNRTAVQRGRQYELDQVRAGTFDGQWVNNDGALDSLNASGPWFGHIMPYQPARVRAQWPPTVNLLTQVQATGGDLGGYAVGTIPAGQQGISVFSDTDSSGGQIVASGTAWQGSNVFQFAVPASSPSTAFPCWTPQVPAEPGTAYSEQAQVRNITASTTVFVQAVVEWHTAAGAVISTALGSSTALVGSAAAAWTQITVSATAPSNAAYSVIGVKLAASSPASPLSLQVDGWQVEKAAAPTAWVSPGVTYPMWSGFIERLPSSWTMSGTYGLVSPTGVDTFALLSQRILRDPLTEEIYFRNPRFLFALGDPQNAQTFTDAIGAYPPAPLAASKYGAGTLTSGNQITAANLTTGIYTGSTGTVVTVNNPSPGTDNVAAATYISLGTAGILGPASGIWSRMLAFRYTASTPTTNATLWSGFDAQRSSGNPSGSRFLLQINNIGVVTFVVSGPNGATLGMPAGSINVVDGNWHLAAFGHDTSTGIAFVAVDGQVSGYSVPASYSPTSLISDNIGAYVDPTVGNGTINNVQGDISFACELPVHLSASDVSSLYSAWKNSFAGDSTNSRYSRILGWAGFTGPTSIQTGLTTSMGAAAVGGQDALSALQAVVDTENGAHYVDRSGVVTFKARSARYNKLIPVYTFGENAAGGEIPYEEVNTELDPTRLANQVKVTQASSSQVFSAQDATSIANFFPRQLTRTVNSSSTQECQDAANYLLSRYHNPAVRISNLKLHPSANPSALWPVCLSLELGMRVRVMRRPPAPAAAIQVDCFVENIAWEFTDQGEAYVTLQCSPVDLTPYGLFASFHTTLNGTIASGVSSITINASVDSTNLAAAQLGQGQQLVLGQNTANQETVTILSVGATSPGWTTAVITLQAATTKSHTAGDVVCEPLPAGVTDPTTWDTSAKFDSMAFAY